jgi:hypothetical protein
MKIRNLVQSGSANITVPIVQNYWTSKSIELKNFQNQNYAINNIDIYINMLGYGSANVDNIDILYNEFALTKNIILPNKTGPLYPGGLSYYNDFINLFTIGLSYPSYDGYYEDCYLYFRNSEIQGVYKKYFEAHVNIPGKILDIINPCDKLYLHWLAKNVRDDTTYYPFCSYIVKINAEAI